MTPTDPQYAPFYDAHRVELDIRLAEPSFWEKWWGLALFIFLILLCLLLLYLIKRRPRLPHQLRYACWQGRPDSPGPLELVSASRRFPIYNPDDARTMLLELRATRSGIAVHRTGNVTLSVRDPLNGNWKQMDVHTAEVPLRAGQTYRIDTDTPTYLRLEMEALK
jgi:hypothetical protein